MQSNMFPSRVTTSPALPPLDNHTLSSRRAAFILLLRPRQLHLDQVREVAQHSKLLLIELPRAPIDYAERSHATAVWGRERGAGVKAHTRRSGDQRVIREARVLQRIGNLHHRLIEDRVGAKCRLSCRLAHFQTMPRLEPLPITVD